MTMTSKSWGPDIDAKVIAHARQGIYDDRSVKNLPDRVKRRYSRVLPNGQWQISDTLRASIDFGISTSTTTPRCDVTQWFDVVFCRNMLIYFDDISRREAVEAIYDSLASWRLHLPGPCGIDEPDFLTVRIAENFLRLSFIRSH